jgi:hypothetical protein
MNGTIEDRISQGGIREAGVPIGEGYLGSNNGSRSGKAVIK